MGTSSAARRLRDARARKKMGSRRGSMAFGDLGVSIFVRRLNFGFLKKSFLFGDPLSCVRRMEDCSKLLCWGANELELRQRLTDMKKYIGILLALGSLAIAQTTYALHYTVFDIELNGANEVGASGDPDGIGGGTLKIDAATNEIVWDFWANNIYVPIVGFHIHNAPAGMNGPVVVNFNSMFSGSLTSAVAQDILAKPSDYYLNIHTQDYPGGAIRGQVAKAQAVPDSSSTALGGLAIGLTLIAARRLRQKEKPVGK